MPSALIDLSNRRYGKLKVIGLNGKKITKGGYSYYAWDCICDCGKRCVVNGASLKSGDTRSCGCLVKETRVIGDLRRKHGLSHTRLYCIWQNMKKRCDYSNAKGYQYYGGRGISYCIEWKNFDTFSQWALKHGYKENLTLDRIDYDDDYSPENCRWVDWVTQENNTSKNHFITYNNETHTISEWSRIVHINRGTLQSRINKGWDIEKALFKPILKGNGRKQT